MKRYHFIDAVRGAAIVPMVVNHTGHAWLGATAALNVSALFYATEMTAAPLFLFIAGFSLVLSYARAFAAKQPWELNTVLRAVFLIVLGYFLNLVLFPGQVTFLMGPLQTIGLGSLLLMPVMPLLNKRWLRYSLVALAVFTYLLFVWQAKFLVNYVLFHQLVGEMVFFSMPPWPWVSFIVLGAAFGGSWCAAVNTKAQVKLLTDAAQWGLGFIALGACGCLLLQWPDFTMFFSGYFTWFPGLGTGLWMFGLNFVVLLVAYYLDEWKRLPKWLLNFGRHALVIYVVHKLFVVAVMQHHFHFVLMSISGFIVFNMALLFALNELARLIDQFKMFRVSQAQTDVG